MTRIFFQSFNSIGVKVEKRERAFGNSPFMLDRPKATQVYRFSLKTLFLKSVDTISQILMNRSY